MASTSETGHAVNIANFKVLIERCNEFGSAYNPSNSDISITEMTSKHENADTLHKDYITALEETKLPINDREILFIELAKLVVRTYNLYLSTRTSDQMKKDAKGYMLKITGRNVKVPKLEDGVTPDPNHISNSQKSFVQRAYNFDKLVKLYKMDALYNPNEASIQITTLETWVENLQLANGKVDAVVANAIIKRTKRDHALYDFGTGLIDLALASKKYVKSVYGGKSPEAESVNGIKFRRFLKMNAI